MKRFLSSALLIAFGLVAVHGLAGAQTTTFHARDQFAQTHFEINGAQVDISVFHGPAGPAGTNTFLSYGSFAENPDGSATFMSGFGVIPDSAFDAQNLQHFSLNVDTSQVSGFRASTCIFSVSFTFTCTDGSPLGPIQIDWQPNGINSTKSIQHVSFTSGSFTKRLDFDQDESSADATGSYLGSNFTDPGRALIGKARDSVVTITRNN
jgi:hypothetical protein